MVFIPPAIASLEFPFVNVYSKDNHLLFKVLESFMPYTPM